MQQSLQKTQAWQHSDPTASHGVHEWGALDEQGVHLEGGGEVEVPTVEMTDTGGHKNQGHKASDREHGAAHHRLECQTSVHRAPGTQLQRSSVFNADGFEDFDEFVLDFDDYDLLESIHTQLGSPEEPVRK